ncbi:hypothetical protein GF360_01540 [candidate division WWE3 bacterium]|nr:hypothetical protein [candidate division WWE3 bacterium]
MERKLPKSFKVFFWDTPLENISIDKHYKFIIERILEWGDLEEIKWLNKTYDRKKIVETLKNSKNISPKTGNFYALYYKVPAKNLECMKKHSI